MAYNYSSNPGPKNPGPDMADDYETSTAREDKAETDETEETHPTALIPKTLLAGKEFKVGEEVVFKIVHMYEDEVEIEYAYDDEDNEESDSEEEKMPRRHRRRRMMHGESPTMMETESKLDEIAT